TPIQADPVVIPNCNLTVLKQVDIPAQTDGVMYFVGQELKAGDPLLEGRSEEKGDVFTHPSTQDPKNQRDHPRFGRRHVARRENDPITGEQVLGLIDDRKAYAEYRVAVGARDHALKDADAAIKRREGAQKLYEIQGKGGASKFELEQTRIQIYGLEAEE